MEMSFYQKLKPVISGLFGLSHDAIHMYVGLFAFFATVVYWKNNKSLFKALLPGFILSVCMELMDMYDDPRSVLDPDLLLACLHDLINTNLVPVLTAIFIKNFKRKLAD